MARWEERKRERDAARERSRTPYVAPEPSISVQSESRRRGSGVRNRSEIKIPTILQPSPIRTPQRGGTAGRGVRPQAATASSQPTSPKPPATAKPPESGNGSTKVSNYTVSGVEYDGNTGRPVGAPEGGYSLEQDGTMTPHQSASPDSGRTNANGLRQYGQTLGGLNQFTDAFTGGYQLTDIKSAFQSEDLPATGNQGANTDYSVDDAIAMGTPREDALTIQGGGSVETVINPSVPGTTNSTPDNPQSGTSGKPDRADNIRAVRMARTEGSPRGFNGADFSGDEPDNASLASPMYSNSKRNAIRSAFLDTNLSSVKAAAAANAVAGYGKDSNGNARFNYGGQLVNAQVGKEYEARNAAMMGQDPSQYLDIPATTDVQPDQPAASELSPAFAEVKPEADKFFREKMKEVQQQNK